MTVSKISWLLPPSKLKLSITDVHVWHVRLNQTDRRVQQLQQILSDDERLRAERFHFDRDRRRFIVSQGMLRMIIGDYIDKEPSRLQFHSGHRGKPYLLHSFDNDPLQFNLAHSNCWFMKSLTPEDGYVAALAVKGSDFCPSYWKYPEKNQ